MKEILYDFLAAVIVFGGLTILLIGFVSFVYLWVPDWFLIRFAVGIVFTLSTIFAIRQWSKSQ